MRVLFFLFFIKTFNTRRIEKPTELPQCDTHMILVSTSQTGDRDHCSGESGESCPSSRLRDMVTETIVKMYGEFFVCFALLCLFAVVVVVRERERERNSTQMFKHEESIYAGFMKPRIQLGCCLCFCQQFDY